MLAPHAYDGSQHCRQRSFLVAIRSPAIPGIDIPTTRDSTLPQPHPRTLGWVGATALAMGGSNQSLFLMAALFVGQGNIPGQGSAAVPLLIAGLLLSWAAAPG